jgi:transcription elongation factor Elf1
VIKTLTLNKGDNFEDTNAKDATSNPRRPRRSQRNLKMRFECPECKKGKGKSRVWTTSKGVCVLLFKTRRMAAESYSVSTKFIIYS